MSDTPAKPLSRAALLVAGALLATPTLTVDASAESMTSAVVRAVKTNPTVDASRAGSRAAAYDVEESRSRFRPEVSIFGDVGVERHENSRSLSPQDDGSTYLSRQLGVQLSYTLFDGYERANQLYRNAARLDGAILGILAASEAIALNAVEGYVDVVRHRNLLHAARRNLKRHKQILGQIRERVRGGAAPASDAFQIEERVFAAEAVVVEISKALEDANAKYRNATGRDPKGKMSIPRIKYLPKNRGQLEANTIARNYEVQALMKVASENEYAADATASGLMPRVSAEARAAVGNDRNGSRGSQNEAYVGLRLNWKLYDGGGTEARAGAFAARAEEARYRRDVKVRELKQIASRSWSTFTKGRERAGILGKQLRMNKKIVSNYREEYELSKRSLLDVLDAERARFNSEFQQISVSAAADFSAFRMLALQSKLTEFFGLTRTEIAPRADNEQRFRATEGRVFSSGSSQSVFDINIEPLK